MKHGCPIKTTPSMLHSRSIIILAIGLMTVGQLPAGIYLPSMISMEHFFHVSQNNIQYILGIYLATYGLSQLFYGPFSDHYGRRPTVIIGLSIFMAGCTVSIYAKSIDMMYLGSFIQGLGLGSVAVISTSVLRDVHKNKALLHAAAYLSAAAIITPLGSRVIGGYIQTFSNWQYNFIFLLIYALAVLFITYRFLPETNANRVKNQRFSLRKIIYSHKTVIGTRTSVPYGLCRVLSVSGGTSFAVVSPFIFQTLLHMSPLKYAWISIIPGLWFPIGSMLAKRYSHKHGNHVLVRIGAIFIFIGSVSFMLVSVSMPLTTLGVIIPMSFYLMGNGTIFPSALTGFIMPLGALAGTAAALLGSFQNLGRGGFSLLVGYFHNETVLPIAIVLTALSTLCLLISFLFLRPTEA